MISTPFLPTLLLNSLESRYEPVVIEDLEVSNSQVYDIVVLGGGHGFDDRLPANSLLSQNALSRLNEGIRIHRKIHNSSLVLSGYSASGRTTQAEMLYKTAILLGIEKERMLIQPEPHNTYREAEVYSQKFAGEHPVILVTSASHMPRAVMLFEQFGVDVIPSPTNYRLKGSRQNRWIGYPSTENIENLKIALYEYAAILRYSLF